MSNPLHLLLLAFLISSCHTQPSKSPKSIPQKPQMDTTNNDAPDINEIVEEFRDSVQKETTLDSTAIINDDTIRVQVKMEVMPTDSFLLPNRYLEEVQLDSFRAWNMRSTVEVFINGAPKSKVEFGKDDFTNLMDNSLRKYGILMYPEVDSIGKNVVSIDYSISIPFTDVGIGVVAKIENGKTSYQKNPE